MKIDKLYETYTNVNLNVFLKDLIDTLNNNSENIILLNNIFCYELCDYIYNNYDKLSKFFNDYEIKINNN